MFALSIKNRRDDMIRRQAAKKLSSQSKRSISVAINRSPAAVPVPAPPAINRSNSDNQLIFQNDDEMRTSVVLQTVGGRRCISVAGPRYVPEVDIDNPPQETPPRLKKVLGMLTRNHPIRTICHRKIRRFLPVSLGNFNIAKIPNKLRMCEFQTF